MSAQREIDELIQQFCAVIVGLVRAAAAEELERAKAEASAGAPPHAPRPKRRRSTKAHPRPLVETASRAPEASSTPIEPTRELTAEPDLAERLRLFVAMHAAYSARELADALRLRTVDVIAPLRVLVEAARIHKRIEGGQARYYAEAPPPDENDDDGAAQPAQLPVGDEARRLVVIRRPARAP